MLPNKREYPNHFLRKSFVDVPYSLHETLWNTSFYVLSRWQLDGIDKIRNHSVSNPIYQTYFILKSATCSYTSYDIIFIDIVTRLDDRDRIKEDIYRKHETWKRSKNLHVARKCATYRVHILRVLFPQFHQRCNETQLSWWYWWNLILIWKSA